MLKRILQIGFLSAVMFVWSGAVMAAPATPTDIVNQKYGVIRNLVVEKKNRPDLEKAIRFEMDTFVDYDELSKRTLPDQWGKLKPAQRKRFIDGFKQMIQRSYVKKFNPNTTFDVTVASQTEKDGAVLVESTITSGKSEAVVSYAFNKKGSRWMVHDVIIDDVSMVRNYRRQFHKIIGRDGFEGLMSKIEKKNNQSVE